LLTFRRKISSKQG